MTEDHTNTIPRAGRWQPHYVRWSIVAGVILLLVVAVAWYSGSPDHGRILKSGSQAQTESQTARWIPLEGQRVSLSYLSSYRVASHTADAKTRSENYTLTSARPTGNGHIAISYDTIGVSLYDWPQYSGRHNNTDYTQETKTLAGLEWSLFSKGTDNLEYTAFANVSGHVASVSMTTNTLNPEATKQEFIQLLSSMRFR
jgi:hypothetical protein